MSPIEQVEFVCPHCRKRTIARHEEEVYCSRCDVPMQPQEPKTAAAAAANAPSKSGSTTGTKSKPRSKTSAKTSTKASGTTKSSKLKESKTAAAARAAAVAEAPVSVVGDFRCACCGFSQTVAPGEKKPGTVLRCPTCFVKLEKVK